MIVKDNATLQQKMPNVWRVTMSASKFKFTTRKEEGLLDKSGNPKANDAWNDVLMFDDEKKAQQVADALNAIAKCFTYQEE